MFRAGLVILKTFEETITKLKYEDLMNFLINEITKSKFFDNENYNEFLRISNMFNIKSSLIDNLQYEFMQEEIINSKLC